MTESLGIYERHGMRRSTEYRIWCNMLARCQTPSNKAFPSYGGRGITVCERWQKFSAFFADMGHRPDGMSLDRIDNDAGYSPKNCRWAERKDQNRNKRNLVTIKIGQDQKCLAEWCEHFGVSYGTVWARIKTGWPAERALTTPVFRGSRAGIKRGDRIAFGAERGVRFSDEASDAA